MDEDDPMPEAPATPDLDLVKHRHADSSLLLDFVAWCRTNVLTDAAGHRRIIVKQCDAEYTMVRIANDEDLIARFYGTTLERVAADRAAVEKYARAKIKWALRKH